MGEVYKFVISRRKRQGVHFSLNAKLMVLPGLRTVELPPGGPAVFPAGEGVPLASRMRT